MFKRNRSAGTAAQKTSKSSLLARLPLLLAILMLCAVSVEAQTLVGDFFYTDTATEKPTLDTIKVLLLVSDTSIIHSTVWCEWGYQVRYKYCCINGNTSNLAYYQPVPYYEHFMYLNNRKAAFKSGVVVWHTVAR